MPSASREGASRTAAVLLGVGALYLIYRIFDDSPFDGAEVRAIQTAMAIAFFLPLTTAGMHLARRRPDLEVVGYLAALAVIAAAAVVIAFIWSNQFPFGNWKPTLYALILGLAIAQVPVLLALSHEKDPPGFASFSTARLSARPS